MIKVTENLLGKGIYSPAEAAFFARVSTRTMTRWIFGNRQGAAVVRAQFPPDSPDDPDKTVSFLDFVQALAIRAIRTQYKLPLEKIRQSVDIADEHGISYPFARPHRTFLFSDKKELGHGNIVLELDGQLIQASGTHRRTQVMRQIAEYYLSDLTFDPDTGLADKYIAFTHGNNRILMNPRIRFGEPFVESCGYTAQTLWEAVQIEGSAEAAARAYEVTANDIETAYRFYDHLMNTVAA